MRLLLVKVILVLFFFTVFAGCVNWNYLFGRKAFFHSYLSHFPRSVLPYSVDTNAIKRGLTGKAIKVKFREFIKDYPKPKFTRISPINNCYPEMQFKTDTKFRILVVRYLYLPMGGGRKERQSLFTYNDNGDCIDQLILAQYGNCMAQTGVIDSDLQIKIRKFKDIQIQDSHVRYEMVEDSDYGIDSTGHFFKKP